MRFVNEFIPEEDVEKYGLEAIDENFIIGGTNSRQWTIDRERDIYLRNVARGGGNEPEIRNQWKWTFYWHGNLINIRLDLLDGGGGRGKPGWSHWKLIWVNGSHGLPEHLHKYREEILADLKEALIAYKGSGVYSKNTSYSVILDISNECTL
ncbi:MAG: hypothetical protein LBL59_09430 [Xanthomonadaceae bacterium]|jgi:hypothetical protein|nr:hypothetical protein [Xanthomonadaceae bacterium]